jgi:hypothetical protein
VRASSQHIHEVIRIINSINRSSSLLNLSAIVADSGLGLMYESL